MNAEFQRIVRRDKKAFLSDGCKEREENNRMGKTRDLFKKIRDRLNKGQKWYGPNRNRRYEKEVARVHRRTTQKGCHDADEYDDVITHLEPDILE